MKTVQRRFFYRTILEIFLVAVFFSFGRAYAGVSSSNVFSLDNQNPIIILPNPVSIDTLYIGLSFSISYAVVDKHLAYADIQLYDDEDNMVMVSSNTQQNSSMMLVIPPVQSSESAMVLEAVDAFGNASEIFVDDSFVIQKDKLLPPSKVSIRRTHRVFALSWQPSLFTQSGLYSPADYYIILKKCSEDHGGLEGYAVIGVTTDNSYIDRTNPDSDFAFYQILAVKDSSSTEQKYRQDKSAENQGE